MRRCPSGDGAAVGEFDAHADDHPVGDYVATTLSNITIDGTVATLRGAGTHNGVAGHRFELVADQGLNSLAIVIRDRGGAVVVDLRNTFGRGVLRVAVG